MSVDKGLTRAALKKLAKFGHEPWNLKQAGIAPSLNGFLKRGEDYGVLEHVGVGMWKIADHVRDLLTEYYDQAKKGHMRGAEKRYGKKYVRGPYKKHQLPEPPETGKWVERRSPETPNASVIFWGYSKGKKLYQARVGEFVIIGPRYRYTEVDDG